MKVSKKKRPNQKSQRSQGKRPKKQRNKGKQAKFKFKSKATNEAKPIKKGLKRRPNSNNNPTADTLRTLRFRA
jgi:hypothetical protein